MSDIDDVLDQFMCEGVSGDWFARCERALLELAQLRRAVEALRPFARFADEIDPSGSGIYEDTIYLGAFYPGESDSRVLRSHFYTARAILAEIDGKEKP